MLHTLRKSRTLDEGAERAKIVRGQKAEALLRDETFNDAFNEVEKFYRDAWRQSDPYDVELRERAYVAIKLIDDLKNQVLSYVRDGVVAREVMERALRR